VLLLFLLVENVFYFHYVLGGYASIGVVKSYISVLFLVTVLHLYSKNEAQIINDTVQQCMSKHDRIPHYLYKGSYRYLFDRHYQH